jgi:hypothetical protein
LLKHFYREVFRGQGVDIFLYCLKKQSIRAFAFQLFHQFIIAESDKIITA